MRTSVALCVLSAVAIATTNQAAVDRDPWSPMHERAGTDVWSVDNANTWNMNGVTKALAHSWNEDGANADWRHQNENVPFGHQDSIHKGDGVIHFGTPERTWEIRNHDNTDSITWKPQQKVKNRKNQSNDRPRRTKHRKKKNHKRKLKKNKSEQKLKSVQGRLVPEKSGSISENVFLEVGPTDTFESRNNDNKRSHVIPQGTTNEQTSRHRNGSAPANKGYWYSDPDFPGVAFLLPGVPMGGSHVGKVRASWRKNTDTGEMGDVPWERDVQSRDVTMAHRKGNALKWGEFGWGSSGEGPLEALFRTSTFEP